jgi:hypothetical protein
MKIFDLLLGRGQGFGSDIIVFGNDQDLSSEYPATDYSGKTATVTDDRTVLGFKLAHNGLYISNGTTWNKMNLRVQFTDDSLEFRDDANLNKILKFNLDDLDEATTLLKFLKRQSALTTETNIQLDTVNMPDWNAGQLWYDNVNKTATADTGFPGVRVQIGQEDHVLFLNDTGSEITNGKPINQGGIDPTTKQLKGILANASIPALSLGFLGLATFTVPNGQLGLATPFGDVNDVNSIGLNEGGVLYLGNTVLTNTRPKYPSTILIIGTVKKVHATEGVIFVKANTFTRKNASRSYGFTSVGIGAGTYWKGGFYDWSSTSINLTQASLTQTHGTVGRAYAAHVGIVPNGPGTVDTGKVGLRVVGIQDSETGVQLADQTGIITEDITTLTANIMAETVEKFSGQISIELYVVSGVPTAYSLTFNYGYSKYEDLENRNVTITAVECVWQGNALDTEFDVALLHHKSTGWTYAATGFNPGDGDIVRKSVDQILAGDVVNNEDGSWKRVDINQFIEGNALEGILFQIITTQNNTIQTMDIHLAAVSEELI